MDKNIGKAIQRAVQSKKYIKRIQLVDVSEYQNYLIGEIIRYVVIFKEENGLEDYIVKLIKAMQAKKTVLELNMIRDTTYASKIVTMITKRKHKITQEELNEKVFDYMYKNLITYGYVFHAFNGKLEKSISKNGLDITKKTWEDIKIERIDNILKKYGIEEAFWDYKLFSKEGISITSSFSNIYNYAKMSPAFFSNFILNINYEEGKLAIYNKDIVKIKEIVLDYLKKNKIEDEDKEVILSFVEENIEEYLTSNSEYVALIERNNIEFLRGMYISYSKYLEVTGDNDPDEYSIVSYILKVQDKFNDFNFKEKIKKDEIMLVNLPEFKANKLVVEETKKVKEVQEEPQEIEDTKVSEPEESLDKNRKVIKINGDILFGYIKVKTSLNKIKQDYLDSLTYDDYEEEEEKEDDHVLTFASLNDKKEENKEKEDDHVLTFASLNDKKEEKIEEKSGKDLEKEKIMEEFSNSNAEVDILAKIEAKIEASLKEDEGNSKINEVKEEIEEPLQEELEDIEEVEEQEYIEEEPEEIEDSLEEEEPLEDNVEHVKKEIVVEKVVVEKITKKYKVQSKKIKLRKKGELTSKEKIDLAIKRAQRRKEEEAELKEENENLLKIELANIEKFAMNIIDEISEKVEKEIEIVKNTKIFKEDMTKEELDEFNQSVIDKVCASNIDENVVEEKIKEYNPIEEYEKKMSNLKAEDIEEDVEVENEYDPIAAYEEQLKVEKEEQQNSMQAKLEELFTPIVEEEINKVDSEDLVENVEVLQEKEDVKEEVEEIVEPIIKEDEIDLSQNFEIVEEVQEIKEELPKEQEDVIPITVLKEDASDNKQVFKIEDDLEENIEEKIEENEKENPNKLPKFIKTELKPETKRVIDKIKEKALNFITRKDDEQDLEEDVEDLSSELKLEEDIENPVILETEESLKPEVHFETLEENDIIEVIEEKDKESIEEKVKSVDDQEYKKLEVCNVDDIDVSEYLNNVISKKVYEEDIEEEKEKQEVIDKILDKKVEEVEEVKDTNIIEEKNIETKVVEENDNVEVKSETCDSNLDIIESLENIDESKREEKNIENEEESLQVENINEVIEEPKKELSEEEIMKLIQEDELYMDDPQYVAKENKYSQKYKDIIPNDMETSLIVKTTLMESFKLALKEFTRKIVTNFTTSMDEESYENKMSKKQKIRRSPRFNEFGTYNDYKKVNKIDRVVNLMDDKSLRENRPRLTKEQKNEMIRSEKESFIENLYKEININAVNNSVYNK